MNQQDSFSDDFQDQGYEDSGVGASYQQRPKQKFKAAAARVQGRQSEQKFTHEEFARMQADEELQKQEQAKLQSAIVGAASSEQAAKRAEDAASQAKASLKEGIDVTAAFAMKQQLELYDQDMERILKKLEKKDFKTVAQAEAAVKEIQKKYEASGLMTELGAATTPENEYFFKDSNALTRYREKLKSGTTKTNIRENAEMLKMMENNSNIKMIKLRNYLIKRIRREYGPDIALKVSPPEITPGPKVQKLINKNSSITDVLNMMSFLINEEANRKHIVEMSIETGAHDEKGLYLPGNEISAGDAGSGDVETWNLSLANKAAPFNLKDLKTGNATGTEIIIPQGIIKRDIDYRASDPITLSDDEIKELFIECVKQLIHIADNTRTVFSGWTKLFQETSGGGSRSKSKTKKKHHHDQDK
jgi:hypothetical protein